MLRFWRWWRQFCRDLGLRICDLGRVRQDLGILWELRFRVLDLMRLEILGLRELGFEENFGVLKIWVPIGIKEGIFGFGGLISYFITDLDLGLGWLANEGLAIVMNKRRMRFGNLGFNRYFRGFYQGCGSSDSGLMEKV